MEDDPPIGKLEEMSLQSPAETRNRMRRPECGATKSNGLRCMGPPVSGGVRCKWHGGMQTGPKVWKANGQFSGRLAPLAAAMQHYLNDERILDLTPTLALMDVQIDELLERGVLDADTPEWRSRMADTCEEIVELMLDADPKQRRRMVAKMVKLTKAMRAGVNRDRRKAAAISLAERRSVRAEAALALKIRADQNITYKQAIGLCHDVFAVVREVVTDRAIADAVITGVGRRFGQRSGVARDSSVRREGETKHNVAVRLIEERGQAGEDDGGSE